MKADKYEISKSVFAANQLKNRLVFYLNANLSKIFYKNFFPTI